MDSMRNLSTSLPRQRNESAGNESADILSDFRAAALSVTNLYKNAVKAQSRSRAAGYQDALHDLLAFLDKESLGLMDGEGWKVRQLATPRLDGDGPTTKQAFSAEAMADDDDDNHSSSKDDDKDDERSLSPETVRKTQHLPRSPSEAADEDALPQRRVVSEPPPHANLQQGDFNFRFPHTYPSNYERDGIAGMELDSNSAQNPQQQQQQQHQHQQQQQHHHHSQQHQQQTPIFATSTPSGPETLRIIRPSRTNRHISRRNDTRGSTTINFNMGSGTGSKRKIPYPDFFDISGLHESGDRKDGPGSGKGGKRGRHV